MKLYPHCLRTYNAQKKYPDPVRKCISKKTKPLMLSFTSSSFQQLWAAVRILLLRKCKDKNCGGQLDFVLFQSLVQRFSSVTSLLRGNSYEIIFLLNHVFLQNVKYLLFLWYNTINTLTDFRKFVIGLIKTRNCSLMMNSLLHRAYCTEELSNWVKAET